MPSMRRLAVVIAIASLSGLSPSSAAPPDGKAEFLHWAHEVARGKKLLVCRAGQLRYPGEEAGYFAALGDPKLDIPLESSSNQIVLLSNGKKRWRYAQTAMSVHIGCGVPAPWEELDTLTIHAQDLATKYLWDKQEVTFVSREPVMLKEVHSDIDGDTTVDWLKATQDSHDANRDGAAPGQTREDTHGMLLALPADFRWIKAWKTPTFVSFGEKNRTGSADADLAPTRWTRTRPASGSSSTSPTIAPSPRQRRPTRELWCAAITWSCGGSRAIPPKPSSSASGCALTGDQERQSEHRQWLHVRHCALGAMGRSRRARRVDDQHARVRQDAGGDRRRAYLRDGPSSTNLMNDTKGRERVLLATMTREPFQPVRLYYSAPAPPSVARKGRGEDAG
jgi:hypothetical protein